MEARNEKILLGNTPKDAHWYDDLISGYGACNFGHCNPQISPFKDAKADIAACFYPEAAYSFSEWLLNKLNLLNKFELLIQVGGSFAVSTAIALANRYKAGKVVYIKGSFHGLGLDSLSVTSAQRQMALQNTAVLNQIADNYIQIDPLIPVAELGLDWSSISCLIFEPIQGANGYIPLNIEWLKELIVQAKKYNVTTIADEIQCGYYRHGHLSVSKENLLEPDIYLFSKSLTNGLFPFSVVVYSKVFKNKINDNLYLAHTFQTSALGCYAMTAVSEFIDNNPIRSLCEAVQAELEQLAIKLRKRSPYVSNIYVTGPTISFETMDSKRLVKQLFKEKILVFTGGNNGERLRIAPPITIPANELCRITETVLSVLDKQAVNQI